MHITPRYLRYGVYRGGRPRTLFGAVNGEPPEANALVRSPAVDSKKSLYASPSAVIQSMRVSPSSLLMLYHSDWITGFAS